MKYVALFTRAWIEILRQKKPVGKLLVALFTRAWIEILRQKKPVGKLLVALFTRAWIEIYQHVPLALLPSSRPLHEGVD